MPSFMTNKASKGVMGFLIQGAGSKAIAFVICIWIFSALVTFVTQYLPDMIDMDFLGEFPSYTWYFFNMFALHTWIAVIAGIDALTWLIRRLPIVG